MDEDITITPAQRAYLTAFDHWLKTTWAPGKAGSVLDTATDVKTACLNRMLSEPRPLPTCTSCGETFVIQRKQGRRRVKCYACNPAQYTVLAA